jgi:FKBP-type peptidyl-prolyl cis-trans isomerase
MLMGAKGKIQQQILIISFYSFCCLSTNFLISQSDFDYRFKTTKSGLAYKILKKGKGKKVENSTRCFVLYSYYHKTDTGKIKTIVENAKKDFIIGQDDVLKGWDEGFQLLKEGDSVVMRIPPSLAYRDKKMGSIQPNSTLYLRARLFKVQDAFFNHSGKDTITYPSGLKKILVTIGSGPVPQKNEMVRMRFTGYVYSTKGFRQVFESSYTNSAEAVFQLGTGRMLKGMDEGVATMQVGEKSTFIIPPSIGFGDKQAGRILPNTTLHIDIELVSADFPVLMPKGVDTLALLDSSRILPVRIRDSVRITKEDIVTFNFKSYYFDSTGKPLVFDNSFERLQPIVQRPGSEMGFTFLNEVLMKMGSGEKAVVILPSVKAMRFTKNPNLQFVKDVFFDIHIEKVEKYPFMKIMTIDTVKKYSGLKYLEGAVGRGDTIRKGSTVSVQYSVYFYDSSGVRYLLDGTRESGKRMELVVGQGSKIPGFEEGLLGMLAGGSRRLIIPPYLGYGDAGLPDNGLPPNKDLIFDIENVLILK